MTDLTSLDAVALRRRLGARLVSATEVVEACIARIEEVNPSINAVVATAYERALAEAAQADRRAGRREPLPPLHGLPVLVKDLTDTEGIRTTYGSRCFADHTPDADALVVEWLRRDGAIVLGKTNTPEFGAGANTINTVYGATGNPHDVSLTAGGSSGGSAAALAARLAPLATGSDLGGSLRIPASFCGVVGMRPTPGLVPSSTDVDGFSPLWTDGPMGRTVADVSLLLQSISGFDQRDPLSTPGGSVSLSSPGGSGGPNPPPPAAALDLTGLRCAVSVDLGVAEIDRPIAQVFNERIETLRPHLGAIEPAMLDLSAAERIFRVLRAEALHAAFAPLAEHSGALLGPNVRANLAEGAGYSMADTADCRREHTALYRKFQELFQSVDVLICPATGVPPFPIEQGNPDRINDRSLDGYYSWYAITWALSLTGSPVVTVPCGLDHTGMPFGVQLVGPRHGDHRLLAIAEAFEQVVNHLGIGRPPTRSHTPDSALTPLTRHPLAGS